MTIEEKARAYDEVRKKIAIRFGSNVAEEIFSVFEESEDERIRKQIKAFIKSRGSQITQSKTDAWIAWLEKQGEHKESYDTCISTTSNNKKIPYGEKRDFGYEESEDERIRKWLIAQLKIKIGDNATFNNMIYKALAWLEKQGANSVSVTKGNTSVTNAEVVSYPTASITIEPKFKVGDWVVTDKGDTVQIGAVNNGYYTLFNGMDFNMSYVDRCWHLWTIEDAKDGDVLVTDDMIVLFKKRLENDSILTYFQYDIIDDEYESGCHLYYAHIYPATKEQRDLLFQKMKESGYEWDSEKKELKKIIDEKQIKKNLQDNSFRRMFEQKPAWSEEDEKKLLCICAWIKDYPRIAAFKDEMYTVANNYIDWLKSLKERIGE